MECNREEAIRAKQIAEQKMEKKDFLGARKFAIKAQKLYSELENISQLIMICDVHCSAESKIHGTEMDWYGILKIEPTADDALIKKQFRKFALILHPDKNKFAGAADAFKLIGEAQSVLLDRDKRKSHDDKCKFAVVNKEAKEANGPPNVSKAPGHGNRFMNSSTQFQQAQQNSQTGSYSSRPTFWTACPFCSVRYQYYRDVLNKLLGCQSCGKSFTGYEVTAQRAAPKNNLRQPVPKQKRAGDRGSSKVGPQSNVENTTKVEVKGNSSNENTWFSEVATGSKPNEKIGDADVILKQKRKAEKPQPRRNMSAKKRRQLSESSESCNTENSTESEEEVDIESGGFCGDQLPRRSSRCRSNVSYSENIIDDNDTAQPSGGNNCSGTAQPTTEAVENSSSKEVPPGTNKLTGFDADVELNEKVAKGKEPSIHAGRLQTEGKETENGKATEDAETKPEVYDIPDPDFSNFDKEREENCFAAGQIWAIYDNRDAMPRYYAQIRKVLCPHFKLRMTWLEVDPDPNDKEEIKWSEEELPISCGNFRYGSSENTEDHLMFSHLVCWENGRGRDTFLIYPRKGETWALFKNWDLNWSSDPDNKQNFTYEFVEILSDYADGIAISVAHLYKVKGFSCLFCRTKGEGDELFEIAPKELLRFSHRIPSFRLTGKEREDVPAGSFELDLACLPTNIQEHDPASLKAITENMHSVGSCSKFSREWVEQIPIFHVDVSENQAETKCHSDTHVNIYTKEEDQNLQSDSNNNTVNNLTDDSGVTPTSLEEAYEIPEPEFHNFDADKSVERLEIGQIWALYCDEDGLPKYYGIIKRIDLQPELKVHITWLVIVKSTLNGTIQWIDKKMPITCGRFTYRKTKKPELYTGTGSFSHQVRARVERTNKKDEYLVFPRKGEVWALYKNWNAGMKCSDLENCEYQMVEVIEENDLGRSVLILEPVDGFKSVFKALPRTITVPSNELLRFSHQIPAFRLTEERDGSLRGYLELDPAALPFEWFCSH